MKLVAYLRVSTDDKGQDPERQRPILEERAKRDGHQIVGWMIDEGTSGNVPAMERPKVKQLILLAHKLGARGIMAESVDRWTRAGPRDMAVSMFFLERDHGLTLLFADVTGDEFVVELLTPIMATLAKMDNKRKSDMAKSSAAQRRAKGIRLGRPPKPPMTDDEFAVCVGLIQKNGRGLRMCALEISRMRGAGDVADPKVARTRKVSENWVAKELANRTESQKILGRSYLNRWRDPHRKGPIMMQAVAAGGESLMDHDWRG